MTRPPTDLTGRVAVLTEPQAGWAPSPRVLAEAGATVVLADVSAERLAAVAEELRGAGLAVRPHVVDLVDEQQIVELVAATVREHGRLDVPVNMAATTHLALKDPALGALTAELWDATLAVNARGPALLRSTPCPTCSAATPARS